MEARNLLWYIKKINIPCGFDRGIILGLQWAVLLCGLMSLDLFMGSVFKFWHTLLTLLFYQIEP